MTPKEKAEELVHEMWGYCSRKEQAKECALIAVDLKMEHPSQLMYDIVWFQFRQTDIDNWFDTEPMESVRMNALEYYNEVKKEIEKL